ncbi:restriction endonuclease subunit S [Algoriphagus algorifonticola]|uniref:restriction endonuclease subunit S n=1 Tax=Algoriphagus algorifonticola TaxID=2593007 RepID=UPI0011A5F125|nr:restriction endonuclease subunit S [Algoriphagus algorifonticola]
MSEWREVKLGEFCKIQGGYAFKSTDFIQKGIPVVKIKNVKEREIDLNDCGYVDESMAEKCSDFLIKNGDVLISMTGSGMNAPNSVVGRVARHSGFDDAFLINQRVGRFLIKDKNRLDKHFLFHYLTPKERQWELVSIATGSANQVNISGKQIESLLINLPPLPEQKAIAHILGTLDEKIELNRKMNQTLEAMAQGLFKSWFVDFDPVIDNALAQGNPIPEELQARAEKRRRVIAGTVIAPARRGGNPDEGGMKQSPSALKPLIHTNPSLAAQFPASFVFNETLGKWIPEGWEVKKLQELVDVKYGKDHKKLGDGKFPCYGSGGVMRYVEKPIFKNESVLIPRKGSLDNVMYVNTPFWSVDTMFYTEMKEEHFVKYFFYTVNKLKFSEMNEGSAVPSMTTAQLNSMDILVPSFNCLSLFDKTVSKYFKKKEGNEAEIETLNQMRDKLLPELISGRVRVNKQV